MLFSVDVDVDTANDTRRRVGGGGGNPDYDGGAGVGGGERRAPDGEGEEGSPEEAPKEAPNPNVFNALAKGAATATKSAATATEGAAAATEGAAAATEGEYEEVYQLTREGEGWGEAILPTLQVVRRPRQGRRREQLALEGVLEALGMDEHEAADVVVAACAWRVTRRGRALLDKRLRRTVTRNVASLLALLGQLGASGADAAAMLVQYPELLGSSVGGDSSESGALEARWFRCFVTEVAVTELPAAHLRLSPEPELVQHEWREAQRTQQRRGKMSIRRRDLLERIGFDWGVMDDNWEVMFDAFVDTKYRGGGVCSGTSELAAWARRMRRHYHAGQLPQDAISRLGVLEFDWGEPGEWALDLELNGGDGGGKMSVAEALAAVREAEAWDRRLLELITYKDVTGDCNVPRDFRNFPGLWGWSTRQRYLHRCGRLAQERFASLDELGFDFATLAAPSKDADE